MRPVAEELRRDGQHGAGNCYALGLHQRARPPQQRRGGADETVDPGFVRSRKLRQQVSHDGRAAHLGRREDLPHLVGGSQDVSGAQKQQSHAEPVRQAARGDARGAPRVGGDEAGATQLAESPDRHVQHVRARLECRGVNEHQPARWHFGGVVQPLDDQHVGHDAVESVPPRQDLRILQRSPCDQLPQRRPPR